MREILFKAKRIDNGKWVEGCYAKKHDLLGKEEHFIFFEDKHNTWRCTEVDPETLCQFTGLCDKNGKKIWENDILTCHMYIGGNFADEHIECGFVEMKHGAFGLHRKRTNAYYRPFKDWLEDYEYEVIGNIYEGGFENGEGTEEN